MAGVSTGRAAALAVHFLVGCRDAPCGDYLPPPGSTRTYRVEETPMTASYLVDVEFSVFDPSSGAAVMTRTVSELSEDSAADSLDTEVLAQDLECRVGAVFEHGWVHTRSYWFDGTERTYTRVGTYDDPVLSYPADLRPGSRWQSSFVGSVLEASGWETTKVVAFASAEATEVQEVSVPFGTFEALSITYSVEHDVYGYGDEDAPVEVHDRHQLVPGVGVVRTSAQELVKMVY